jgi:hypothetical protein
MIRYHKTPAIIAELLPESEIIDNAGDMLDIIAEAGYNNSTALIIHKENLNEAFFDLKTGIAGDILQKFSNYRMRLAVVGDFTKYKSKSLSDFIGESNRYGVACFVNSLDEALERLG